MSSHISWVIELAIKDGQLNNVTTLMKEMVESTRSHEPHTLNYEWSISPDKTQIHIYERYADSAAAVTHLGNFGRNFAQRFLAAMTPTRIVAYGSPNAEARKALEGLRAAFMEPFGGFAR